MNSKSIRKELSNAVSESYNFIENLYLMRIKHIFVKRYLFYNWSNVFSSCSDSGVFFVLMLLITYFAVYHQSFREIYPFNFNLVFFGPLKQTGIIILNWSIAIHNILCYPPSSIVDHGFDLRSGQNNNVLCLSVLSTWHERL